MIERAKKSDRHVFNGAGQDCTKLLQCMKRNTKKKNRSQSVSSPAVDI